MRSAVGSPLRTRGTRSGGGGGASRAQLCSVHASLPSLITPLTVSPWLFSLPGGRGTVLPLVQPSSLPLQRKSCKSVDAEGLVGDALMLFPSLLNPVGRDRQLRKMGWTFFFF